MSTRASGRYLLPMVLKSSAPTNDYCIEYEGVEHVFLTVHSDGGSEANLIHVFDCLPTYAGIYEKRHERSGIKMSARMQLQDTTDGE